MRRLIMRMFQEENDYWRIRNFLRQTLILNELRQLNWHVARLDYWRWHVIENGDAYDPVEKVTYIWETPDGKIAAVLNPEGRGDAFLHVHPAFRTKKMEEEMIAVAEKHLANSCSIGRKVLYVWAHENDDLRKGILEGRGYTKTEIRDCQHRRSLAIPIPDASVAKGYVIRALGDEQEIPARSWASWRAFHPNEPDEKYDGWEWYHNIQKQPLYRRDLDIVAVAPEGEIAAFCTIWYDDFTRTGYIEPVGTVPEHQRRGLGKTVMLEGLRRLKRMGAVVAFVSGFSTAANALYFSVMSDDHNFLVPWKKEF
ncbi:MULTISPECIES: GNAT family N-acetyltransferase [Kosmotoga]|uniref:GCN5-related N-acetyltransferase n=1 Tax=Kosmotoga olearia (strain ATCC BAA-1733 / DSM 21960 / TBF 19.5.1) TaxID=521045 RepID=C5CG02_KOSOT|nr:MULTISPECIES: GNAT family N-acetyltransferase [Kosmotoga]ACR80496.1 GCN5-related N-acetyltransferase [Kosmotoga olearia TBF 19.5.1]MDI3524170.1 mycothiol synthase [Kosmotoga sp.]MDK2954049.1 mycothiol synthase [Kosmotoga sp.]OAA19690.1 GCN5 family acetyltransferase [Kosmotoga sp. DU53]